MSDKNMNPDAYIPADAELSNQDIDRSIDDVTLPLTNNVVSVVPGAGGIANVNYIQGDVVFQFSTGEDEYIQIPKSFIGVDYGVKANTDVNALSIVDKALAPCLWQNARFEIEGQRIATSNNYTFDWALSNRLQYSASYNKLVNQLRYSVVLGETPEESKQPDDYRKYTSVDNMSAFFYRTENLLLPPNTHYKITLSPESYESFIQKCSYLLTTVSDVARLEVTLYRIYMNLHRIRRTTKPAGDYTLRFLTVDSNMSTPAGSSHNIQYQVSSKMRKCGVAMVSTTAKTSSVAKVYGPTRFRYATDQTQITGIQKQLGMVDGAATGLYTLQLKSGSLMMPNTIWNFQTTGLRGAYLHFLNSVGKSNDVYGVPESFEEWLLQGPIYVEDVVKGAVDLSTNLEIQATFNAQPAANMYTFQINENFISWTWGGPDNAIPIFKNLLV